MQQYGIFFGVLFIALGVSSLAVAEIEVVEECTLEDNGEVCDSGDGVYGTCREVGPNGCNGENPDYPGQCRGYPSCSGSNCFGDKEVGDHCEFNRDLDGICQLECDVTGENCTTDERLVCDITHKVEPESGDENGGDNGGDNGDSSCATAVGGPEGVMLVLGLLLVLAARRGMSPLSFNSSIGPAGR